MSLSHCEQHPLFPVARACHKRLSCEAGFNVSALATEKFPLWEMELIGALVSQGCKQRELLQMHCWCVFVLSRSIIPGLLGTF